MEELLTIQEVAAITRLHEMTIRRYIRSGKLEALRVGRHIRIQREALERFMRPVRDLQENGSTPVEQEAEPIFRDDDPIFDIVDLGELSEPLDISGDKYRYFAEVFR